MFENSIVMRNSILHVVLAGHCAVCLAGCGSGGSEVTTFPVTGAVTYQGQPVQGAVITFHAGESGQSAMAVTDDSGNFEVRTRFQMGREEQAGMVEGEYQVTVTKMDVESIKSTMAPPKNLLPSRYASPASSPLAVKVSTAGENRHDFRLD